jgi:hypothetical protein
VVINQVRPLRVFDSPLSIDLQLRNRSRSPFAIAIAIVECDYVAIVPHRLGP